MNVEKAKKKIEKKKLNKKKKSALVLCQDGKEYWTTQTQFWQWVRDGVIMKSGDWPLQGRFIRADEEYTVMISNTILNLKCPNHLSEVLYSRRKALL